MNAHVEFYTDTAGLHRWHLIAPNQGNPARVLAESGQGYSSRSNARRAWRRVEALITAGLVEA